MSSIPLHYIDLRAFCYVTEDESRVEDALRTFLPDEFEIEQVSSTGHHGDQVLVLSARLERADEMQVVLDRLAELSDADVDQIREQLDERVNENCAFFLTLDKQAAFNGRVATGDGMTLRAKIEAYPAKKENAIESIETILEEL